MTEGRIKVKPGIPPVRYNDTRQQRITLENNTIIETASDEMLEAAQQRAGLEPAYRERLAPL